MDEFAVQELEMSERDISCRGLAFGQRVHFLLTPNGSTMEFMRAHRASLPSSGTIYASTVLCSFPGRPQG